MSTESSEDAYKSLWEEAETRRNHFQLQSTGASQYMSKPSRHARAVRVSLCLPTMVLVISMLFGSVSSAAFSHLPVKPVSKLRHLAQSTAGLTHGVQYGALPALRRISHNGGQVVRMPPFGIRSIFRCYKPCLRNRELCHLESMLTRGRVQAAKARCREHPATICQSVACPRANCL